MSKILSVICLLFLLSSYSCLKYENIYKLGDVLGSGDNYPSNLPVPSSSTALQDKKVLFAFSHGVEDQEVYYFYNYLIDRGTNHITLGIDYNGLVSDVILSDFYKPSYRIPKDQTRDINQENFEEYDIIYIPGGFPSSSALRKNQVFLQKLRNFYANPQNSEKLIAFMCSGTELSIQSLILNDYLGQEITGSPAAVKTFQTYLKANNIPQDTFTSIPSINFKLQNKPRVILARDPNASTEFVMMVSNIHFNLNENTPTDINFVPMRTKREYPSGKFYLKGIFELLSEETPLNTLPQNRSFEDVFNKQSYLRSLQSKQGKISLMAISSGVTQGEIDQLIQKFNLSFNNVYTVCPSWVKQYKDSQVFTFNYPPTKPIRKIICDYSFDDIRNSSVSFDNLFIPGGLFSTNAVLRNDDGFIQILNEIILQGKQQVILSSSALGLLLPLKLSYPDNQIIKSIQVVPADKDVEVDTQLAGLVSDKKKKTISYNKLILTVSN